MKGQKVNYFEDTNRYDVYNGADDKVEIELKSYRIINYKAFHDSGDIALKPLVMFYGCNSAGKTAIHQPLILLMAAREQDKKSTGVNKSLIEIEGSNCSIDDIRNQAFSKESTRFVFCFSTITKEMHIKDGGEKLSGLLRYELSFSKKKNELIEDGYIFIGEKQYSISDYFEFENVFFLNEKMDDIPYELRTIARSITDELRRFADELSYMGPIRKESQREFVFSGKPPKFIGREGAYAYEKLFSLIGSSKIENEEINNWISEFGYELIWKAKEKNKGRLVLKDRNTGLETNIVDNGFGIGQSLPVIVQMATMHNGTFLSDSPDAFLQANMQGKMADYVINCVKRGNRLIVETGSEAFLYRIRRNISQKVISADDVILYYIDAEKAGDSKCVKIDINERGQLSRLNSNFNRFFSGSFNDLSMMSMGTSK